MTLAEFFDLHGLGHRERAKWNRFLAAYDFADITAALDAVYRKAQTTSTPTLAVVRAEIDAARSRRLQSERGSRDQAQGVPRENSAVELALFAVIRALNARGALWDFVRGCWVTPNDPDYQATLSQSYAPCRSCDRDPRVRRAAPPCAHCGPAPTLGASQAKWRQLYGDEPMPRPFASALAALSVTASEATAPNPFD